MSVDAVPPRTVPEDLVVGTVAAIRAIIEAERAKVNEALALYPTNRQALNLIEGPARAAKMFVDMHLRDVLADAALPTAVIDHRRTFDYRATGPNRNVFDFFSLDDRTDANDMPITAQTAYEWISDRESVLGISRADGLIATDTWWEAFAAEVKRRIFADPDLVALLPLIDRFSFARTGAFGTLWIGALAWNYDGTWSPEFGVRHLRWKAFFLTVHEYIHTLEHPIFTAAKKNSPRVMEEGFCETFTRELIGVFKADLDNPAYQPVWQLVCGATELTEEDRFLVTNDDSGRSYDADVELIAAFTIGRQPIPPRRLKAGFFQGHVEYLNLTPTGDFLLDEPDDAVFDIALPDGTRAVVPGWEEHRVVSAIADGARYTETLDQIVHQHGITLAQLHMANPALAGTDLTEGTVLVIPPRTLIA